ncbi:MAG TPA: 3-oxoacyl-[acyl-carrier-protein] synthase III C-terminal domain-containing protein [Kofleriaceae bacterium]|nr:3-oxoacyl-[acyl-carrier-protein] synthase III C-terminal domain-containing protein [Kofleriaceae bacterium]
MQHPIGLLGVATYLPPETRPNAWWPAATVARWQAARPPALPPLDPTALTDGMKTVLAAMSQQVSDPFHGVVQRHVMPAEMTSAEMEAQAAERAIAHAAADPAFSRAQIDAVLVHTAVPEYLISNTACVLHHALGLAPRCLSLQADASSHSFMTQLTLAEHMILSGRARYVLLVQSAAGSRLADPEDSLSPMFGDGAAATVVGRVSDGGLLATVHHTHGNHPRALIASVPGGRWYDEGRVVLHSADPVGARQVFLKTVDFAVDVVGQALREAQLAPADIEFFAVHQGTPWLRSVTQAMLGLGHARSIDTFDTTGYLFGASIPLVLETAQRTGAVARGDRVVIYGGGVGAAFGAIVLRWGAPVA